MMPTLLQQLQMSFDAENTTAASLERAEQQRDPLQLQQQMEQHQQEIERDPLQLQQPIDHDPLLLQQRERDPLQFQQQRESIQLQSPRERDSMQFQQQRDAIQLQQQRERDAIQFQLQRDAALQLQRREKLQSQQREREHWQHRDKVQMQQREHIAQLQSINNLLLDLPSSSKGSYRGPESYTQSLKGSTDGDMSISELFGLGLPRGSLMGSQSSIGSSSYRQQLHAPNNGHSSSHLNYPCEEGHGFYGNTSNLDMPGTPNSATTPGSPSTPGSVYSNPYSYSTSANSTGYLTSSQSNRSHCNVGSPASPGHSQYYGRPIRGSPAYNDCGSPTLEYAQHLLGFGGSRSNSPADSETSGYCSVDSSLSDIMNCLSMSSSGHYPPAMSGLMPPELEHYRGGNKSAYQRMAVKKYQQQQHSNSRHHHCCTPANHVPAAVNKSNNPAEPMLSLDRAAKFHRNAAALCEPTCTWVGELPKRVVKPSGYSPKVFFGGMPWDVTEPQLIAAMKHIGPIRVEWPDNTPKGYAYIIFESEKSLKTLFSCCTVKMGSERGWFYKITPKRSKPKDVEVIPWHISESNYSVSSTQKLDPEKTVFVGALHGMMTAEGLAKIMSDLFGEVIYAGLDTDKHKYPLGSARVTFSSKRSYKKACAAAFVAVKTKRFTKTVQIDPYIEDSVCSLCTVQHGPYFCREPICSRYFCRTCWHWQHASEPMSHHFPMSRDSKSKLVVPLGYNFGMTGNRLAALSMI